MGNNWLKPSNILQTEFEPKNLHLVILVRILVEISHRPMLSVRKWGVWHARNGTQKVKTFENM